MSILDKARSKLSLGGNDYDGYDEYDEWNDDYADDFDDNYDDYAGDFDDEYSEDYGSAPRQSAFSSLTDRFRGNSQQRQSRASQATPFVDDTDVRASTRRSALQPDYEASLSNYKIEPRDNNLARETSAGSARQESLEAARAELDQLQHGVAVPLNSYSGGGIASNRNSYDTPSTVSRRIVTVLPKNYADAEKVSEAFRSGSSVVISLVNVDAALGKRLMDFCFGVVSVSNGSVEKIGSCVFFLSRGGRALTESEKQQLRDSGIL